MTQVLRIHRKSFALGVLEELSLARSTEALARLVERTGCELTLGSAARLYLYQAEAQRLVHRPEAGADCVLDLTDEVLAAKCAAACQPLLDERDGLAVPLTHHAALDGVLVLEGMRLPAHESLLEALGELCGVAAVVLASLREIEGFERLHTRTQELLVRAVEASDPPDEGHVARVGIVAAELAGLLDLSTRARRLLWEAAQYHDVGRLVLAGNRPEDIERHHAHAGAEYLRANPRLFPIAALVAAHHHPYDPAACVPLEGWVLALAEDLEEGRRHSGELAAVEWIASFLEARAERHHPEVVEALREVVRLGRLASIYGGASTP